MVVLGKGGKERIFPIEPFDELKELLIELKSVEYENNKLFKWKDRRNANEYLKIVCRQLKINCNYRSFHSVRKYIENKLVNEYGVSNFIAAQLMGHTVKTQSQHYAQTKEVDALTDYLNASVNKVKIS